MPDMRTVFILEKTDVVIDGVSAKNELLACLRLLKDKDRRKYEQ